MRIQLDRQHQGTHPSLSYCIPLLYVRAFLRLLASGKRLYGKYENSDATKLPQLDVCGGHFGKLLPIQMARIFIITTFKITHRLHLDVLVQ